jgi:uncharacterized protein
MAPYLPEGLAQPIPVPDGLDAAYWEGLRQEELRIQRCADCAGFQWLPEWTCHRCGSRSLNFQPIPAEGTIYAWERVWHPPHPGLADSCPFLIIVVELTAATGVKLVGNLLGDPMQQVSIGVEVAGVFEHQPEYSLLQWQAG